MTSDEQKRVDQLQEQLKSARQAAEDTRFYFASALGQSRGEARLYRGLFWVILALAAAAAIVALLQR